MNAWAIGPGRTGDLDKHTHSYTIFLLVNFISDLMEKMNWNWAIYAVHAHMSAVCLCGCWQRHCLLPEWICVSGHISQYTVNVCVSMLGVQS